MRKYFGTVIHQSHDDDGILEVVESEGLRSLHFGSESRQSCMLVTDPHYLQLSYLRAMMGWNLFREGFDQALMIGLGGGSMAKHLLYAFPSGQISAVECRRSVVTIARSHFGLPFDSRLKVIIGDGGHYIQQAVKQQRHYDLLLIDAFDHEGLSESINGESFFDACRIILRKQGIMMINLWRTDIDLFEQIAWYLSRSFDEKILYLPVMERGNVIVFCFPEKVPQLTGKSLRSRAEALAAGSGIEYPDFLQDLKKYNSRVTKKLFKL